MQSLEGAPDLRAKVLIEGAGVHEKIARKKSTTSAAEDLKLALDEGVMSAAQLLTLLPPDDRVRYLDSKKLWAFTTEDEFWSPLNAEANVDGALSRMVFLLENALKENLMTLQVLTDGITFDSISTRLPLKELQKLVRHALKLGREKKPLGEAELLESVPLKTLIGYIPLEHVYNNVIVERVAKPANLLGGDGWESTRTPGDRIAPAKVEPNKAEAPKPEPAKVEPPKPEPAKSEERQSVPPPKPPAAAGAPAPSAAPAPFEESIPDVEDDVEALIQSPRPAAEEEARRKVIEKLTHINRLPPRHDALSTPVLLSIESMYSELLSASTDEAREMSIRDSFPNEQQLTSALLALIELLDPTIDVNDPVIKDADVDSLIKVVIFEERHRYEQQHPSVRPAGGSAPLPPPNSARKGSAAPPPLPRPGAAPPPPLPEPKRAR